MADKTTLAELFTSSATSATALHVAVLDQFGTAIYDWDPVTLWLEIQDEWGIQLANANQDKLQAMITAVGSDLFYKDPQGFYTIGNTLAGNGGGFEIFEPMTASDLLWSVYEVALNRDPEPFSLSVQNLMEHTLREEALSDDAEAPAAGEEPPEATMVNTNALAAFLASKRDHLSADLTKLKDSIPDLPSISQIIDPVLGAVLPESGTAVGVK